MAHRWIGVCGLVAAGLVWTGVAHASTFTATELSYDKALLSQFNLINLGDYSSKSSTEGRVIVGGAATGSSTASVCTGAACTGDAPLGAGSSSTAGVVAPTSAANAYGALTVFGNVASGFTTGRGDIDVGGNISGTYNLNNKGAVNVTGGNIAAGIGATINNATGVKTAAPLFLGSTSPGTPVQTSAASVFPFANAASSIGAPLKALASGIAALPGSPNVSAQALPSNQNALLTAGTGFTVKDASGTRTYGVVTTTLANLATAGSNFAVSNGSNAATFVIVTGDGANFLLPSLSSADSNVIFDFVDATTLRFGSGGFNGSILAPLANITTQGGTINGSVVVQTITQTAALLQGNAFTGDLSGLALTPSRVPEPASLVLAGLGVGLGVAARAGLQRRRRSTAA